MSDTPQSDSFAKSWNLERGIEENGRSYGWGALSDAIELMRKLERCARPEALPKWIDLLEVYGTPEHPAGVTFAIAGMPGRYETARAAVEAAVSPLRFIQCQKCSRRPGNDPTATCGADDCPMQLPHPPQGERDK